MRTASGKGNDVRKVLAYYRTNFNLNPPYRVLCDGPTIHQSLQQDLYLKDTLPKLLGATAFPVVTACILKELRSLGDDFSNAALFAKRATRVPCMHNDGKEVSACECIIERLENREDFQMILASNDPEVIAHSSRIPGVPLISISKQKKLVVRPPSTATLEFVQGNQEVKGLIINAQDRALLKQVEQEEMDKLPGKMRIKQIRKRKRAKGPNPLSVKKSKKPKLALTKEYRPNDVGSIHMSQSLCSRRTDKNRPEIEHAEDSSITCPPTESQGKVSSNQKKKKTRPRNRGKKRALPEGPDNSTNIAHPQTSEAAKVSSKLLTKQTAEPKEASKTTFTEKSIKEHTGQKGESGNVQMKIVEGPKSKGNVDKVNGDNFRDGLDHSISSAERTDQDFSEGNSKETVVEPQRSLEKEIQPNPQDNRPLSTEEDDKYEKIGKIGSEDIKSPTPSQLKEPDKYNATVIETEGEKNSGDIATKRKKQRKNRRRRPKKATTITLKEA